MKPDYNGEADRIAAQIKQEADARSAVRDLFAKPAGEAAPAKPDGEDETLVQGAVQALAHAATEDAVALAFAIRYKDGLRFNHRRKLWHVWDGTRWRQESTELAFEFARRIAREVNPKGKATMSKAGFARGVEAFARADRVFALAGDEFDRDPMLLNTPVGTVDLRTGEMRAHRREHLLTRCTAVAPVKRPRPVFERFIADITCGDAALADYLQRALGACLSGALTDHWILFWYGKGRNGKNTLGELIMHVLADYARKIPAATLMHDPRGERHPTEIANLLGARLAFSSEVSDRDYWHESRIKELTGDDMLSGRFMRADFFEFRRTHKHLVYGNYRPMLRVVDPAIAERLHMVPFGATFTTERGNLDPEMPAKLWTEAEAVLAWLIEGHEKWREDGTLRPCAAVAEATQDYLDAQGSLDAWITERCETLPLDERPTMLLDRADRLYRSYAEWKEARGEQPMSQTRWGEQMQRRFAKISANGIRYRGLKLVSTEG